MPKLKPGDKAPDFILPSADGSKFALSQGWNGGLTILTFYRGDSCPVCNIYLRSLNENVDRLREAGAQIVAISSDKPELERQTVEKHGLAFPVLSDPERRAVEAYDVVFNEKEGHAEPAVFLISSEGSIIYESIASGPLGRPTVDDLLRIVQMVNRR